MAGPQMRDERYTHAGCASWPEFVRNEFMAGEAFAMTPAPGTMHQALSFNPVIGTPAGSSPAGRRPRR
jgi:hypothetical protein